MKNMGSQVFALLCATLATSANFMQEGTTISYANDDYDEIQSSRTSPSPEENNNPFEDDSTNKVLTKSGPVIGIQWKTPDNKVYDIYYGIPFAKPPTENLRFQPPQKIQPWTSTLQAVQPGPICYQQIAPNMKSSPLAKLVPRPWSENCLTLNVWVPSPRPSKAHVVVFIHGGGFQFGSSLLFVDGTALNSEGVVVVSMNYRLGVFGFLSLGVDDAPGNVGLMDQQLALQWVRENIEAFGGDSLSVTLMGMSAGSASVGFHLLAPSSRGLFHRAVMMSGAPTNWWAIQEPEQLVTNTKKFLKSVGCCPKNITEALACVRSKHPDDIGEASLQNDMLDQENFFPTIDGKFLVEHPLVSAKTGKFNPSDVLIGSTVEEGAMFIMDKLKTFDGRMAREEFVEFIRKSRKGLSALQVEVLNVAYTNWNSPDDPIMLRDAAKDLFGHGMLVCDIDEFAEDLTKAGHDVYRYEYTPILDMVRSFIQFPDWLHGALHGADQLPVLGPVQLLRSLSESDEEISKRMLLHVASFVKNGNPNLPIESYSEEPRWPKYTSSRKEFNSFDRKSSIRSETGRSRHCATWLRIIPMLEGK